MTELLERPQASELEPATIETNLRRVQDRPIGQAVTAGLDKVSSPLWLRLDDFVRCVIGVFFVAIFADGFYRATFKCLFAELSFLLIFRLLEHV